MTFYPPLLNVEITTRCNAQCVICARGFWGEEPPRPIADMSWERCRRLLDLPWLKRVSFGLYGEPLLWPYLVKAVAYATKRGLFSWFTTNAQLLDADTAEALFDAGLGRLVCSVDALNSVHYARIRRGLSWATVLRNIDSARAIRDQGRYPLRIVVNMVMTEENRLHHHQKDARAFWKDRVDGVGFTKEIDVSALPGTITGEPVACERLYEHLTVLVDGQLGLCCRDAHGIWTFGNVFEEDPLELFNGEGLDTMRDALDEGKDYPAMCRGCRSFWPDPRPPRRARGRRR